MILRNKTLPREILEELEHLDIRYFQQDKPVPFKEGLTTYPVLTEDYMDFMQISDCLTLNKNETIEGLKFSHLGFLINKMEDKEVGYYWARKFSRLLELVFRVQNGIKCNKCKTIISLADFVQQLNEQKEGVACKNCGSTELEEVIRYTTNSKGQKELIVDGVTITSKDYDRLRQIIMYQNLPDYQDESWVDPEIREDQRLKQEILAKKGGGGTATLERKVAAISSQTSYKFSEIYKMPMRKFLMLLGLVDDVITYQADRTGMMSGMVSFKKPLEHWLYKPQKSMYGDAVTQDAYTQQIAKANS